MQSLLVHYFTLWRPLGYVLVFFGMVFEGEAVLFAAAFLAHAKFFALKYILPDALAGLVLGDTLWFFLGARLRGGTSFLARRAAGLTDPFMDRLKAHPRRTIFVSKFTYGFNHILIMRAGMIGLDFWSFARSNLVATLVWLVIVGSLGYFSSAAIIAIRHYLRFAEVALILGLVIFLLFWKIIAGALKRGL